MGRKRSGKREMTEGLRMGGLGAQRKGEEEKEGNKRKKGRKEREDKRKERKGIRERREGNRGRIRGRVLKEGRLTSFLPPTPTARVVPYKCLAGGVELVEALPKNALGKVMKRKLRDEYMKKMTDGGDGGAAVPNSKL